MNKQGKKYRDANGEYWEFNVEKFKAAIDTNARTENVKKNEYIIELATKLSCSNETVIGWKKGKNSPQDIELVHLLEKTLGLQQYSLLYSKGKELKNELNKYKNMNIELTLENKHLTERLEQDKSEESVIESSHDSQKEKYHFIGHDSYSLRYDGFSNLIDFLLGKFFDKESTDTVSSTYAEYLSYILEDYINNYNMAELLGFNGHRSKEEIIAYKEKNNNIDDNKFMRWIEEAIVDYDGKHLYDEKGSLAIEGRELFDRLKVGNKFNDSDITRVGALIEELYEKLDNYVESYATIEISIMYDDFLFKRFTYGNGYIEPTNDDRMDIINELLFISNGDISKYSLHNVKKFYVDEFECEIEIAYDLKDLI